MLHIGLIGAGFIGIAHANAVEAVISEKLIDAEFVAVCDSDTERAQTIAGSFGASTHSTNGIRLIESGDIDTVFICTPTRYHPALVKAAAEKGLNIFCEKPLARSFAEAKQMQDDVVSAGVKNQVGLVLRYSPVYNIIKTLTENPDLGRPMSAIFRDDQYFPIRGIYRSTWRGDVETAGGGTLIEHSIHDVDVLSWFFGELSNVSATVKNFAEHEGVEDLAAAQFQFQSGCTAQLTSVWHNVMQRESNRYVEIFFENGYISSAYDFIGSINYQFGDDELTTMPAEEVLDRYLSSVGLEDDRYNSLHSMQGLQDYHFLRALESDESPHPDFDVALKAHEVVEAIYSAARGGSRVELPL